MGDAPSLVTWATTHCTHEGVQMLEPGRRGGPSPAQERRAEWKHPWGWVGCSDGLHGSSQTALSGGAGRSEQKPSGSQA